MPEHITERACSEKYSVNLDVSMDYAGFVVYNVSFSSKTLDTLNVLVSRFLDLNFEPFSLLMLLISHSNSRMLVLG